MPGMSTAFPYKANNAHTGIFAENIKRSGMERLYMICKYQTVGFPQNGQNLAPALSCFPQLGQVEYWGTGSG